MLHTLQLLRGACRSQPRGLQSAWQLRWAHGLSIADKIEGCNATLQGMELGLHALAAGGSIMVGTLQGGHREQCRFEPERDDAGKMVDMPAFDKYLAGIRKEGTST